MDSATSSTVQELTTAQARDEFDKVARETLGVSREEFMARLDDGQYDGTDDDDVLRLVVLAPFGR